MKTWLRYAIYLSFAAIVPRESFAQGTDVGISGIGLVSIQPVESVAGPYLNEGLGGFGPGWGGGVSVITPVGFVVAGEFTTARFEVEQQGRFVGGCHGNDPCLIHTSRLHDALLSGLIGYAKTAGRTSVLFLGGVGVTGPPTVDGVDWIIYDSGDGSAPATTRDHLVAISGGLDVLHTLGSRAALVISGRYSFIERYQLIYLGMRPHVFRIGVGMRVRIN